MHETGEAVKALPGRVYSKELIEVIFRQPYSKTQFLVDAGIAERKTAAGYLRRLESSGILRSQSVGREVLFLNTRLYELLAT
jgi:GTP-sensing pleiotropic transcriptional regulator CodY